MNIPEDLLYTADHEWVRVDEAGTWTIGITEFAQDQLGDVVFVELPGEGTTLSQGEAFGVVESVKAVSDIFAPADGELIAANDALEDAPEKVNESPWDDGWLVKMRPSSADAIETLLSPSAYHAVVDAADG